MIPSLKRLNKRIARLWNEQGFDGVLMAALGLILLASMIIQFSVSPPRAPLQQKFELILDSIFGRNELGENFFLKHVIYIFLGIIVFIVAYKIPTEKLKKISWIFYGVSLVLLVMVLFFGKSALGAQRWLNIAGFRMQPSEPAKIGIILALATWLSRRQIKNLLDMVIAGLVVVLVPFGLIFLQPDLGTSMVLIAIFATMSFAGGAKFPHLLIFFTPIICMISSAIGTSGLDFGHFKLMGKDIDMFCSYLGVLFIIIMSSSLFWFYKAWKSPGKLALCLLYVFFCLSVSFVIRPFAWDVLEPYQQKRLTIFIDPYSDPRGDGYNIIQSLLAIGGGSIFGYGYMSGPLTQGSFVPEQHTDFVFSSIAEEWGFLGSAFIVVLFLIISLRILRLKRRTDDPFEKLLCSGILTFISFHALVNIGMNLALLPVTGVPLPFISHGGTAIWCCLFCMGIIQRIHSNNSPKGLAYY